MNLASFKSFTLVFALALTACATPKTSYRFYTLANPNSVNSQAEQSPAAVAIVIEVLPVNIPERFKRPQLVITDKNATQLKILEQDRWSSAFNDELQDAFVSGLTRQLNAVDISRGGRIANQPTYRIAIALQQFNATPGDQVQANFGWTITRLDSVNSATNNRSLSCQTTISKTVGNETAAVVKGVQEAVADTIQAISANVSSLSNGEAADCSAQNQTH